MWVRRSAIKPVPRYARVPESVVALVEARFARCDESARRSAAEGLARLESEQAALASYLKARLPRSLDQVALRLGHMLAVAVFMAFEALPGTALLEASADLLAAAEAALGADEELRRSEPLDALDSEDIVAIEQPALMAFVNQHIDIALEQHADSVDVDDVDVVFRLILVEILALSRSVAPPPGYAPEPAAPPV